MCVAETAVAAVRDGHALSYLREVGEQGLAVLLVNLRADRYFQHHVLAIGAGAVLAHTVAAALRLEMLLITVVDQCVEAGHRLYNDVAAITAIAAVGAAEFDELLAPERHAAVSARAGRDVNLGFVEELHGRDIAYRSAFCTLAILLPRVQKVSRAVFFDALQQVDFPREIGVHCRLVVVWPIVGLEPDVNRVVSHFFSCRERKVCSGPGSVATLEPANRNFRESACLLNREAGEHAILACEDQRAARRDLFKRAFEPSANGEPGARDMTVPVMRAGRKIDHCYIVNFEGFRGIDRRIGRWFTEHGALRLSRFITSLGKYNHVLPAHLLEPGSGH